MPVDAVAPATPTFVHLRLHSEFSVVDGTVRIAAAVARAAADGQGALALTDNTNVFGTVRFYTACRKAGVKPILGCDLWVSNDDDRDAAFRLPVLVQGRAGWLNLCRLLTQAYLENQHRGRAEIRQEWLGAHGDGLIALSGARAGQPGVLLAAGQPGHARAAAQALAALLPGRYYLELQRDGSRAAEAAVHGTLKLALELGLPVVATHPVQFLERDDFRAHEARVCIAAAYTLSDPRRPRHFTAEQYMKSAAQMCELFADIPAALANSVQIAQRCNLELQLGKPQLPAFPTPPGVTLDEHIEAEARAGLERRLAQLYADDAARDVQRPAYVQRLLLEVATIAKMGFSGYFLIVADFINWAKRNGIPVGPGRGSGAGSLVAYALGITDLDPLRYELLFERFLNPERVSMPDFDIDFCQDKRERVIEYVKNKYGADAVSQIATFGTLGAKAVVRDVGRVLDMPYTKCDQLSKLIPHNPADPWTLDRALAEEPAFREAVDADEEIGALIALARPLEGLTRNVGMHAGGVLIAPGKLTDFCPLYSGGGAESAISQFDKDDVEAIGLVKFDFLGLTTLTILALALEFVRRLDPQAQIDLDALPLDDAATFRIFQNAATTAIFQFESRGMRELLKRARPDRLEDLIALNALYRPGPMDLIPDFIERKHGRQKVEYLHPAIETILSETYGVMVYQEQVMRIAQVVGGYSLGSADLLRRAMGKKKPEEMAKQRTIFVEGARAKDVREDVAAELFDHMEKFAGYGFNKCVVASTQVMDATTGRLWSVGELFAQRGRIQVSVHALDDRWRLNARPVRDVVWNGRRPVFELRTALGKRLRATANHPVRTFDGWKTLDQLRPGERIAAPRRLVVAGAARWGRHQLVALGGLLCEGNTCHPSCLYYYNNDEALIADFVDAATAFPHSIARVATRRGGRMEVCVSTGRDARFRPRRLIGIGGDDAVVDPVPMVARSGLYEWARELGILGVKADAKRVPAGAFELDDASIALLLGRMWSGDGFYANATNSVPFYATSSEGLALDVQALLLRLGIVTRLQRKSLAYRGERRAGFAVFLIGDGARERFIDVVVPHCVGRADGALALPDLVAQFAADAGIAPERPPGDGDALSDVYWDTAQEIVPCGIEDVYDLEVEGDHNFVADGLVVHNSHSAAYALVAYQTAYLKAHHPAAFMAANLSTVMDDTDKVKDLIEDARAIGLAILPPDINASAWRFEPVDARSIRYGLGGIKGTGQAAIEAIVEERRTGGTYSDLFDLAARVDKHLVNRRVLEALARAGALDRLHADRAVQLASVGRAMAAAESAAASIHQTSLFGGDDHAARTIDYVPAAPFSEREKLAAEKLALGFYFSGHLFTEFQAEARRLVSTRLADLKATTGGRAEPVRLVGVIVSSRSQNTRRGRMGVVLLDDMSAQLELMIFSELYDRKRALLKEDELLFVTGKVRYDDFTQRLTVTAEDLMDLAEARARASAQVTIDIEGRPDLARLREVVGPFRVDNPAQAAARLRVRYRNREASVELPLGPDWRVRPDDALLAQLRTQGAVTGARVEYR